MPYIYDAAIVAHKTAVPVMRAMLLEFPDDACAATTDTQYLLGSNLLVAPVFCEAGDVKYYVPKGSWYGWLDGKVRNSTDGKWFTEKHDFKSLPLLVRPNSIIISSGPLHINNKPDYSWNDDFTINIYDIQDEASAKIPDHKTKGEYNATITAKNVNDKSIEVRVVGSFKKPYTVKLLNSQDQKIKNSQDFIIKGNDTLGNILLNVEKDNFEVIFE